MQLQPCVSSRSGCESLRNSHGISEPMSLFWLHSGVVCPRQSGPVGQNWIPARKGSTFRSRKHHPRSGLRFRPAVVCWAIYRFGLDRFGSFDREVVVLGSITVNISNSLANRRAFNFNIEKSVSDSWDLLMKLKFSWKCPRVNGLHYTDT